MTMEHEPQPPAESLEQSKERVRTRAHELLLSASKHLGSIRMHDRIVRKAQELRDKHPDAKDRMWFHVMIGGSLNDPTVADDFPGEDSIEKFLQALIIEGRCFELRKKIIERLGPIEFNERVQAKSAEIFAAYPDARKHVWYHGLVGSSPPDDTVIDDFPGEHSVEQFLESLLQ